MDATCFSVDWITRTAGPTMGQSSGFWTHIVAPAHVTCPWDYPNYYPPTGDSRFVSKITYGDTRTQIRVVSNQGDASYKFFLSQHYTFNHSNPRLDLSVIHPEQLFKRAGGESKLLHMQNQGLISRPMLDIVAPVQKGDIVWIYGYTAEEALFDEEKAEEPKMLPTAIRGVVHATTREQFWVDTMGEDIFMGMCGAPIMRNGKCIGMLTAKVHALSDCKELAGCAMCTYSKDIFEFLVEVEEQLKNGAEQMESEPTKFQRMRKEEAERTGVRQPTQDKPYRSWDLDQTRIARRVQVPVSLFAQANEQEFNTQEDAEVAAMYGPSGPLNEEVQENLGFHMNVDRDKHGKPDSISTPPKEHQPGFNYATQQRRDPSPEATIYGADIGVSNGRVQKQRPPEEMSEDWKETLQVGLKATGGDFSMLNNLRKTINSIHQSNVNESMRESAFATSGTGDQAEELLKGRNNQGATYQKSYENDMRNGTVDGKPVPKEFAEGVRQYAAVNRMMKEKAREGQQGVERGPDPMQGDVESPDAERVQEGKEATHNVNDAGSKFESDYHKTSSGKTPAQEEAELARRMARKAKRAAERAKKDAEHEAALRARHSSRTLPIACGGEDEGLTSGLW